MIETDDGVEADMGAGAQSYGLAAVRDLLAQRASSADGLLLGLILLLRRP